VLYGLQHVLQKRIKTIKKATKRQLGSTITIKLTSLINTTTTTTTTTITTTITTTTTTTNKNNNNNNL
jgi:hypothetical protein